MTRLVPDAGRCAGCALHVMHCVCEQMPALTSRARWVVARHGAEAHKTTNSGRLVARCVAGTEMADWMGRGAPWDLTEPDPTRAVLLFPASPERPAMSIQALAARLAADDAMEIWVLDGTWKQTRRMARHVPGLAALPRIELPPAPPSALVTRRQVRGGMNTAQAVARLMIALGETDAGRALLAADHLLTVRILESRGLDPETRAALLAASRRGIHS